MSAPVIIHAPNWVGDHVMAFPFYHAAAELLAPRPLHLLGRSWVNSLLPDSIFDKVFALEGKKLGNTMRMQLSALNPEIGITLSPSFRSARYLQQIGIQHRLGYATDMRKFLLRWPQGNKRMPNWTPHEHRSLSYIRLLTPFMGEALAEDIWSKHRRKAVAKPKPLSKKLSKTVGQNPYWVICPGSVAPSKVYPLPHLVEVMTMILTKNRRHRIVLAGTTIEQPYAQYLVAQLDADLAKRVVDLTCKTDLPELLSLLARARGAIANDSGVAHLTYLADCPVVTFIGMARREETLTLNRRSVVLDQRLACSPCKKQTCPRKDYPIECLDTISPQLVLQGMKKLDRGLRI